MTQAHANPVGFLQEFVQKHNLAPFPKYSVVGAAGPDHSKLFLYKCAYDGYEVIGSSHQKKLAKSESAKNMLELLKEKQYFEKNGLSFDSGSFGSSLHGGVTDNSADINLPCTKNPISALQEYCVEKKFSLPRYSHTPIVADFVCECTLKDRKTYGEGLSKKAAKTESAAKMCKELNISFSGEQFFDKKTELESDKNPISVLQELCQRTKYSTPVYEEKASFMNQFVIMCTVGKVAKKGMSTTKKGAKIEAAQNVLRELTNGQTNDYGSTSQLSVFMNGSGSAESGSSLEELDLDNSSGNVLSAEHLSAINATESIALDDTLVEIEPTSTIIIQGSVQLLSDQDNYTKTKNDKDSGFKPSTDGNQQSKEETRISKSGSNNTSNDESSNLNVNQETENTVYEELMDKIQTIKIDERVLAQLTHT